MAYWRLFYHLVWCTREREPLITPEHAAVLQRSIRATGKEHRALVHAVGTMPDHVHVVASIPPSIAIATLVGRMKGSSSHLIKNVTSLPHHDLFRWQAEYGVQSFGEKSLARVIDYVDNQPARHTAQRLWLGLETIEDQPQPASAGFVG